MIGKALEALPIDADDLVVYVDASVFARGASLCDRLHEDSRQFRSFPNVTWQRSVECDRAIAKMFLKLTNVRKNFKGSHLF